MLDLPTGFPQNICAYCGSQNNLERDHVPPKNLFPRPRPRKLISVPSCSKCHSDTSKDDEYFRIKVCLRNDAGDHPEARANWDSIFRSLNMKEAKGLKKSFLSDIRPVQLRTPAGLYVGSGLAYDVDMIRIRRVVERTLRGLYFAESCQPLGLSNGVTVLMSEDLKNQQTEVVNKLTQTILNPLAAMAPKVIGDNVLSYRFQIMEEDPAVSVWGFTFFDRVSFLCLTDPQRLVSLGP